VSNVKQSKYWRDLGALLQDSECLAQVGSWQWDLPSGRIGWSPQLYRILGYSSNVEPSQDRWFSRIHPEDAESLKSDKVFNLDRGGPPRIEFRIVRPSGEVRWVRMEASSEMEDGRPVYMRGVVMDITEQRLLEQQLQHAQKMEAVGRLSGGVAHDFNNLLTVVLSNVERMRRKGDPRSLDAIEKAAEMAAALTSELLTFSRQSDDSRTLDVNDTVEKAVSFIQRLLGESFTIDFRPGADVPSIFTSKGQFQRVLMNLAANARDAMPGGGRVVIVTSKGPGLPQSALRSEATLETASIRVEDTGSGMTEEIQARALDPFFTTKAEGEGTGLGLAGAFNFVRDSGGKMDLQSTPGKGTTVTLHFPPSVVADSVSPPSSRMLVERSSLRVTVVEDNEMVLDPLAVTLREAGHSVDAYGSAFVAWEGLKEVTPDVLVTDVVMGGMSGLELLAKVRAIEPKQPVVIVTGFSSKGLPEKDQFTEILRKPFSPDDVLDAIARVHRRATRASLSGLARA